jgi:electron transfer flavoprotein alpha subunit
MSSKIGIVYLQGAEDSNTISKASLSALTALRQYSKVLGFSELVGVAVGRGASARADAAKALGLKTIYIVEDCSQLHGLEVVAVVATLKKVFVDLGTKEIVFMCAATSHGKDIAPRLAIALNAGQASDITAIAPDGTLIRPMFAGDILATIKINTPSQVITVRASSFALAQAVVDKAVVDVKTVVLDGFPLYTGKVVRESEALNSGRPDLADADVVVSGGRALQSAENFEKIIFPLADALKAGVGASRAAVDAGYAPNDWQVGQTGKVVAPQLYIAVGISGAIQHVAGMKGSKIIVAINKDPEAPIFEVADVGLVADLYDVVPKLIAMLKT